MPPIRERLRECPVQPKELGQKNDLGGGLNFHFQSVAVFLRLRSRHGGKSEDEAGVFMLRFATPLMMHNQRSFLALKSVIDILPLFDGASPRLRE